MMHRADSRNSNGGRSGIGNVLRRSFVVLSTGLLALANPGCADNSGESAGPSEGMTASGGNKGSGGASVTSGTGGASSGGRPAPAGTGGVPSAGAGNGGTGISGSGGAARDDASGGAPAAQGAGGAGGGLTSAGGSSAGAGGSSPMGGAGSPSTPTPVTACATNELSMCKTNATPISESFSIPYSVECHFGGNPGNYEVTVELGGPASADTLVEAERRRPMLPEVMTAGKTDRYSFVVNVRSPEGEPIQGVPAGIAGLDVYFGGTTPRLASICHQPMAAPVVLYVAGDSTVCDQYTDGYASWGQHLPQFFASPISVANYADSGESSVSFSRSANLWGAIKSRLKPGDWVLLEMGHNDKTTSKANFESNMTGMANDAKAAGATPIFVTPISRANGGCAGQLTTAAMDIPQTLKDLGKTLNMPVIDLTTATCTWFGTVGGPAAAMAGYYARGSDPTHTGPKGAQIFAGFVRDAIKAQIPELAKFLRQ